MLNRSTTMGLPCGNSQSSHQVKKVTNQLFRQQMNSLMKQLTDLLSMYTYTYTRKVYRLIECRCPKFQYSKTHQSSKNELTSLMTLAVGS